MVVPQAILLVVLLAMILPPYLGCAKVSTCKQEVGQKGKGNDACLLMGDMLGSVNIPWGFYAQYLIALRSSVCLLPRSFTTSYLSISLSILSAASCHPYTVVYLKVTIICFMQSI